MGACCSATQKKDRKLTYSVPKHFNKPRQSFQEQNQKRKDQSQPSLDLSQEEEKHRQQQIYHDRKKVKQSGAEEKKKAQMQRQQQQDVPQPQKLQKVKAILGAGFQQKQENQKKEQVNDNGDDNDDNDDDDDDDEETDYDIIDEEKQGQQGQKTNFLPMQSNTFFNSILPKQDIAQFSKIQDDYNDNSHHHHHHHHHDQEIDDQQVQIPHYLRKQPSIQEYKALIQQNTEFIDQNFPHSNQSILDPERAQNDRLNSLQWKRARQVYGDKYTLFSDDQSQITPSNIRQGALGDCYILSALSAIAEWPQRIKKLFITQKRNQAGIYAVKLYLNGQLKQIIVDQYFPYNPQANNFAFCSASQKDPQIWPMLIQKAYAKVFGSYQRIQSGTMMQSLQMLTCSYIDILNHKDAQGSQLQTESLWRTIKQADQKQHIMLTNVHSQNQQASSKVKELGLVDNHAYSLINVHQLQIPQQNQIVRLLNIRNPWGKWEWKGDWSDKSDKWTPELKKQVNFFQDKDDGLFFISFEDFVQLFHNTTIARYEEDYSYDSKRLKFKRGEFQLLRLDIQQETDLQFLYFQEVMRFQTGSKDDQFKYDLLNIAFLREEQDQQLQWFSNQEYSRKNNCTELQYKNIQPGHYIIYLEIEKQITKQQADQQLFSWMVVKSRNPILRLSHIQRNKPEFLQQMMKACCLAVGTRYDYIEHPDIERYSCLTDSNISYGGFFYHNKQIQAQKFQQKMTFQTLQGLLLLENGQQSGMNSYQVSLKYNEQKLILLNKTGTPQIAISYKFNMRSILSHQKLKELVNQGNGGRPRQFDDPRTGGAKLEVYLKCYCSQGQVILLVQNNEQSVSVNLQFNFSNCQNLRLKGMKGQQLDEVNLKSRPGSQASIILEAIEVWESYKISYSYSYKVKDER